MNTLNKFSNTLCVVAIALLPHLAGATEPPSITTSTWLPREASRVVLSELLSQAQALLKAGQAQKAFELLDLQEVYYAGNFEFDELLGLAAADAGQITRAVLAFERALQIKPDHLLIKAELGRMYFAGGENRSAHEIFEEVQERLEKIDRHDAAHRNFDTRIDLFLRAVDEREQQPQPGWTPWVNLSFGHDSNVNASTSLSSIALPSFNNINFELPANSQSKSSDFSFIQAGLRWRQSNAEYPALPIGCLLQTDFTWNQRQHQSASAFDQRVLDAQGMFACGREAGGFWSLGLQTQNLELDNQLQRRMTGAMGQNSWRLSQSSQVALGLQMSRMVYPLSNDRNATRISPSISWSNKFGRHEQWIWNGMTYAGKETPQGETVRHWGQKFIGVQTYLRYNLNRRWSLLAGMNWEHRSYGQDDPIFLSRRVDTDVSGLMGVEYRLGNASKLMLNWNRQHNESTLTLYDYHRNTVSASWRAEF